MKVGLIDVDRNAKSSRKGVRFPNLALMKLSTFLKNAGHEVTLADANRPLSAYDALYLSKVFTASEESPFIAQYEEGRKDALIYRGGTGYFGADAAKLSDAIEHSRPDYTLYTKDAALWSDKDKRYARHCLDDSLGFMTRGCFRHCPFCVNAKSKGAVRWSPLDEFLDESRPVVSLLDDNVFAYEGWQSIFDELQASGKRYSFRQGLDFRLMDEAKARTLDRARYKDEVIFAFDRARDADAIEDALKIYRRYAPTKQTTAYVLTGYYEKGADAIRSVLDRIELLARYRVKPYVMRYRYCYEDGDLCSVFSGLAAWCNQPGMFKKLSYFELNAKRSRKAVDGAERFLPVDLQKRLARCYWDSSKRIKIDTIRPS